MLSLGVGPRIRSKRARKEVTATRRDVDDVSLAELVCRHHLIGKSCIIDAVRMLIQHDEYKAGTRVGDLAHFVIDSVGRIRQPTAMPEMPTHFHFGLCTLRFRTKLDQDG
jgi:hypothetical protein